MNRKTRAKYRDPKKSPIYLQYLRQTTDEGRRDFKASLSRKELKKLNRA